MRSTMIGSACLVLLALGAEVRSDEQKIALKDVPKAVLDAVKAKFPGLELTGADKETDGGKTLYEVSLKQEGRNIDVTATPEGKIVEIEREIAAKDLPRPVSTALESKYPKATIQLAEEIIEIEDGKETKSFEMLVVTAAKKTVEVKVSPQGKILKEEDKSNEKEK